MTAGRRLEDFGIAISYSEGLVNWTRRRHPDEMRRGRRRHRKRAHLRFVRHMSAEERCEAFRAHTCDVIGAHVERLVPLTRTRGWTP